MPAGTSASNGSSERAIQRSGILIETRDLRKCYAAGSPLKNHCAVRC